MGIICYLFTCIFHKREILKQSVGMVSYYPSKNMNMDYREKGDANAHWEELLLSVSNISFTYILIISKHCGRTLRGVRGVKKSEIL